MKRFFCLLFLVCAIAVSAQQTEKQRTDSLQRLVNHQPDTLRNGFFKARRFHSSFHVQAEGDLIWMLSKPNMLTGGSVRWVINHKITIGVSAHYLTTNATVGRFLTPPFPDSIRVQPKHFSVQLGAGYVFRAFRKFSVQPELMAGWGYISFHDKNNNTDQHIHYGMVNPAINMIWNASKYFRIGAVVGARGVFGSDYQRLKSYRVGGVYAGLFIRGGTF
ncbi:MAG: hypothetical protein U0T73_05180 [Chitinophagales bacterium]